MRRADREEEEEEEEERERERETDLCELAASVTAACSRAQDAAVDTRRGGALVESRRTESWEGQTERQRRRKRKRQRKRKRKRQTERQR